VQGQQHEHGDGDDHRDSPKRQHPLRV
jgi:hypothetical protein